MSRPGKFVLAASATWLLVSEVYLAHRTTNGQLLSAFISLCFVAVVVLAVVLAFTGWRQRRWQAMVPLVGCVFVIVLVMPICRLVRRTVFAWSLPSYERVVRQIESGSIPVSAEFAKVQGAEREARLTYGVFAGKDTNGILTVVFFTESGFPVLHSGYMYRSSGEMGSGLESGWPINQKLRNRWFYISN